MRALRVLIALVGLCVFQIAEFLAVPLWVVEEQMGDD